MEGTREEFVELGEMIGIPKDFRELVTNHVWKGGDPNNLTWVAEAFTQMGVRNDLKQRWWHSWRSSLGQTVDWPGPIIITSQPIIKICQFESCQLRVVDDHIEADCESIEAAEALAKLLLEEAIIRIAPPGTFRIPVRKAA